MNINYFMNLAILEANKALLSEEIPVGAVLIDNLTNNVICSSHNQVIKFKNPTKHAEIQIIDYACKYIKSQYLNNTSIFITLEPCAMCSAAISEARIDRLYFGAYDEKKGSLDTIMNIYNKKNLFVPEVYGGIKEKECSSILKNFFLNKRKKNDKKK